MANILTPEQKEKIQNAFSLFDKDGNGHITTSELGSVLKSLGLSPKEDELKEMISEVDIDGSGTVDIKEFTIMIARRLANLAFELA